MSRSSTFKAAVFLSVLLGASSAWGQDIFTFIQNGAWCWFQDERAIVDTVKEKLVIGSTNSNAGVDVVIYDLKKKSIDSKKAFGKLSYLDDHNSPGLCIGPDGNYVAIWAHHYDEYNSHYSIFNGSSWSNEAKFDWSKIPGGTDYTIAYSNVYYLSKEKRMFNFARANDRAPNFLYSDDAGKTWSFGGQLTTNSSSTYNKGYYKYWSNAVDRIDMVFTEQHPRDDTTSIYHGYIQGGKVYSTDGKLADDDIYDRTKIPTFSAFTKVYAHNTKMGDLTMGRCWQSDLMRFEDSTIAILFEARANNSENDHRNFFARYDGKEWKITYIGKAGGPMYSSEQDYTGLGALCPDDPNRIYISSPFNPGDDNSKAGKREIWRGATTDNGATWKWEAVTSNSSSDNFRPIVPKWTRGKEALLWWRGTYTTAQNFNTNVVGIISEYTVGTTRKNLPKAVVNSHFTITPETSHSGVLTVQYTLSEPMAVAIELVSTSGKLLATRTSGTVAAGSGQLQFEIGNVPSGVYFCRLQGGTPSKIVRVTLL